VLLRGKKVYDPRDMGTRFTRNPALCVRDYILASYGIGADPDEINEASFIAAANICDEFVAIAGVSATASSVDTGGNKIVFADNKNRFERGTRVQVTSTGTIPGGLAAATNYFTIPQDDRSQVQLATTYANALAGTAIDITSAGSGTITLTGNAQPRYTMDGSFDLSKKPIDVAEDMMTCCAGVLVYQDGQYFFYAGAAKVAIETLDATWLRGDIAIRPRMARRELYNSVRGTFIDPSDSWQQTDIPIVKNSTYAAQDGGREIQVDVEFPFTTEVIRAQRLAKILLERSRQGITIDMPCNAKAGKLAVWSVVRLNLPTFGFVDKEFRIISRKLVDNAVVDLTLQEESSVAYDWSSGDATVNDPAPDTKLALPWTVASPGAPLITEETYETNGGGGTKSRAIVSWDVPTDAFIVGYEMEFKDAESATWTRLPAQSGTSVTLNDLAPATYNFRVRAINSINVRSPYSPATTKEVLGLYAPPQDIAGLTLVQMMGSNFLRWARVTDADVRIGGRVLARWSPLLVGASWANSIDLFPPASGNPGGVSGSATEVSIPAASGTYMVKALDNTGNVSVNAASISTNLPDIVAMQQILTITESPTYPGTKTNVAVVDGVLKLDGATLIDAWGAVDSQGAWDSIGGVATSGVYLFQNTVDLGAVYTIRATHAINVGGFLANDFFDTRSATIDDWDNWDGAVVGSDANAQVEYRATKDDPVGSPAWGPWTPFIAANISARGFQFRIVLTTADQAYNIQVNSMVVTLELPSRVQSGTTATSSGADTTITFSQRFWQTPVVGFTINAQQSGDTIDLVSKTATGFTFCVRNGGVRVVRTVDWLANGFGQGV